MGSYRGRRTSAKLPAPNGLTCMGIAPSRRRVRLGSFEMDEIAAELSKDGAKIRLQEQPYQILQILLERPGEVITLEDLRKRVWPSDTFVDFDHGINNAITRLREALGDTAEIPHFIETLPRRRYRFLQPLAATVAEASIAVLPFLSLSTDLENEIFADGMCEEIISALMQINKLHVAARTSSFSFKGKHVDLRVIGEQLNVRTVLEGSVRKSGNHLRLRPN
jgi:DNA-binding winged helix-turn-helix (wHTH) protein